MNPVTAKILTTEQKTAMWFSSSNLNILYRTNLNPARNFNKLRKSVCIASRVAYPGGEASLRDPEGKIWQDDISTKIIPGGTKVQTTPSAVAHGTVEYIRLLIMWSILDYYCAWSTLDYYSSSASHNYIKALSKTLLSIYTGRSLHVCNKWV